MTALELLTDLIEDPKNNGDYELHLKGEELRLLWNQLEHDDTILRQWRDQQPQRT